MNEMDAKRTIHLTMGDIKELTFHLQGTVQHLQQQYEQTAQENKMLLKEKIDYLKEIMLKLST